MGVYADSAAKRKELRLLYADMKSIRSGWDSTWKDVTDYLLPYHGRYDPSDVNRGGRRDEKIIDSSVTRYARACTAGLMAYNNSASSPWFGLTLSDTDLAKFPPVKSWLADSTERMHRVIHGGNTYPAFHKLYTAQVGFGDGVSIVEPHFERVLCHHNVTHGQFVLADDHYGDINTMGREFQMTAAQMVEKFGADNVSESVKRAAGSDTSSGQSRWTVIHIIRPRVNRDPQRRDGQNKAWESVYFEPGGPEDKILRESGYDYFPVLAPGWERVGGDVYSAGPGVQCLGHIKALQIMAESECKAVEYGVEPPTQGPSSLKDKDVDRLPGGFTPVDQSNPSGGIKELWKVNLDLNSLRINRSDLRQQARETFFADLFMEFLSLEGDRRTAEEIKARREQQMLLLGPVVSANQREMHGPFIEMLFQRMLQNGGFKPVPPELSGATLGVEYVSVLARAQKAMLANSNERFITVLGNVVAANPGANLGDKVDLDKWLEIYSDQLGIHPDAIVPGEKVALIRQSRAQALAAQQQTEMMKLQAGAAKDLAATPTGGETALSALGAGRG